MTQKRALVINVSARQYNLGAHKLADWLRGQGATVSYWDGDPGIFTPTVDLVCLSIIFSWHAPAARDIALRLKGNAEVWAGGPGLFALGKWWKDQTGLESVRGLDQRFELQRGDYRMTFASRGCPVDCSFCIVPRLEGLTFTLDWSFQPAPILCDNNLSALPIDFQNHIIARYVGTGTLLEDANSGFEPLSFDGSTYRRWKDILRGPWRFALDTTSELPQVERMMAILAEERARRKQVYVLIGNEPIAACYARAQKVIEMGCEPFCQPLLPLNALSRNQFKIAHDWTPEKLEDFARYYNRHIWRSIPLWEYWYVKSRPRSFTQAGVME